MDELAPGAGVLAVFAHPDDEVLCAGGTLALCRARGERVRVVSATRGELGPVADPALIAGASLAEVRERELRQSCAALGVHDVEVLGLPDAGLAWAARTTDVLAGLVRSIRRLRPAVLLTFGPDGLYGHPDHVAIGEVLVEARAAAADPARFPEQLGPDCEVHACRLFFAVLTGERIEAAMNATRRAGIQAQLWSLEPTDFLARADQVSACVDVSPVLEAKLSALRCHRTQLEPDHLFMCMTREVAADLLGLECFRCADGLSGDPLSAGRVTAS